MKKGVKKDNCTRKKINTYNQRQKVLTKQYNLEIEFENMYNIDSNIIKKHKKCQFIGDGKTKKQINTEKKRESRKRYRQYIKRLEYLTYSSGDQTETISNDEFKLFLNEVYT